MSDVRLSVETKLYVSETLPANYTTAGFAAIADWVEVGEVESISEFGGTATITPFIPLATGITKKRKGSIDYGTAAMTVGRLSGDAGQGLLKDAFDGSRAYDVMAFRIVGGDGDTGYFTGMVSTFTTNIGDANAVTMIGCSIELDNRVISDVYDFFTVVYAAGANGSIIGQTNQLVPSGGNSSAVYASPDSGYEFTAWSDASTDNPRTDTSVSGNISVTASFSLI